MARRLGFTALTANCCSLPGFVLCPHVEGKTQKARRGDFTARWQRHAASLSRVASRDK